MKIMYRSNPPDGLFTSTWYPYGAPRGRTYTPLTLEVDTLCSHTSIQFIIQLVLLQIAVTSICLNSGYSREMNRLVRNVRDVSYITFKVF
jgi:hypothetical protein